MFVLNDNNDVVPCNDINEWAAWTIKNEDRRRVGLDQVGIYKISTVFLGTAYNSKQMGRFAPAIRPPLCFETMVFKGGKSLEEYCKRYTSWNEALASHRKIVECVERSINSPDGKVEFEQRE